MGFSFTKQHRGNIGIALHGEGMTIGQSAWNRGKFVNTKVKHMDIDPIDLAADDWRACVTELGLLGSDCVIAIAPSMLHCQVIRLPAMSEFELQKAAAWELADRLGLERSTLQADAIRLGNSGDVLSVAIEIQLLEALLNPLYQAGLRPTKVEPQCVSVTRLFSMLYQRQSDKEKVRSILDFGALDSSFTVLAGEKMVFYKHLEFSGKTLTDAIETNTGVSAEQAKQMLHGLNSEHTDPAILKAVHDATRATHEAIATDAMKCNRHYGVTSRGPLSSRIIITGSAGWNQNLSTVLAKACNQKVVQDIEEEHLKTVPEEFVSAPSWHTTLGASLACINTCKHRRISDHTRLEVA